MVGWFARYAVVSETPPSAPPPEPTGGGGARTPSRALIIVLALLSVVVLGAVVSLAVVGGNLAGQVQRVPDVFAPLPEAQRPPVPAPGTPGDGSATFLLVGTDTGNAGTSTSAGPTGESIQLLRIAGDRRSAEVAGISRDTLVDVPGVGPGPISQTYTTGGPSGLVAAVERVSGVRVDHFAVVDFTGFPAMVDALGGIDVDVAETTTTRGVTFQEGTNTLDGARTLTYVRQDTDLAGGDLARVAREQNVIRALLRKALATGILTEPAKTYATLDALTQVVTIDDTLSAVDAAQLGLSLRSITESSVAFVTAPVAGPGPIGPRGRPLLLPDTVRGPEFWRAVTDGTAAQWAQANTDDDLPDVPR